MEIGLDQILILGEPIDSYASGTTRKITYNVNSYDLNNFVNNYKGAITRSIENYITIPTSFRMTLDCEFFKQTEMASNNIRLWGLADYINRGSNISETFDRQIGVIAGEIDHFNEKGSTALDP